jgi:hypothetical protein
MGYSVRKIALLAEIYRKISVSQRFSQGSARLYRFSQDIDSPQIRIEPYEELIDCAVKIIQALEPNYFQGVETIKVMPSSAYGHVSSDDPAVININIDRIKQELKSANGRSPAAVAAAVIAHERGHVSDFSPEAGFQGGEGVAETEERRMEAVIEQNLDRIQAMPCYQKWSS